MSINLIGVNMNGKVENKKVIYYVVAIVFVILLFVFMFLYVGNKIDKSLESSSKPLLEEVSKISGGMKEIKTGVEDNESKIDLLDETIVFNVSEIQLLRDSLSILKREIKSLNAKVNSLVEWQKEQKKINENWASKTLYLLNWKLDLEEAEKSAESKRIEEQSKAVISDSLLITEPEDKEDKGDEVKKNKKEKSAKSAKDNSVKVKDGRY